jgi:hypothetical protein
MKLPHWNAQLTFMRTKKKNSILPFRFMIVEIFAGFFFFFDCGYEILWGFEFIEDFMICGYSKFIGYL